MRQHDNYLSRLFLRTLNDLLMGPAMPTQIPAKTKAKPADAEPIVIVIRPAPITVAEDAGQSSE